jgi:hypothetical protein
LPTAILSLNQWYSFEIVRDETGFKFIFNGSTLLTISNAQYYADHTTQFNEVYVGWRVQLCSAATNGNNASSYIDQYSFELGAVESSLMTSPFALSGVGLDKTPADGVTHLLKLNGANNSTTFTDEVSGEVWKRNAGSLAVISTAFSKFGGASLRLTTTGQVDSIYNISRKNEIGLNAFCIEFWHRTGSNSATARYIFGMAHSTGYDELNTGGMINLAVEVNDLVVRTNAIGGAPIELCRSTGNRLSTAAFRHIAITRDENMDFRMFIEGVQYGSTFKFDKYMESRVRVLGAPFVSGAFSSGYIDCYRETLGDPVYTSNFTPPSAEFT